MQLPTEIFGEVVVVHSPDEMTEDAAHAFVDFVTTQERTRVILDMDATESLDSGGLTALLTAQELLLEMHGDLKIATNNKMNRKILEITRLDQHFEVYETVLDAVRSFA